MVDSAATALSIRVRNRLGELARRLGDASWLDGAFSAGDLMMVEVMRRLKASGMLDEYPNGTSQSTATEGYSAGGR